MPFEKLLDGTEVSTESEEWRHLCEARWVAARPTLVERRQYLEAVARRRGPEALQRLKDTMTAIWHATRAPNTDRIEQ